MTMKSIDKVLKERQENPNIRIVDISKKLNMSASTVRKSLVKRN